MTCSRVTSPMGALGKKHSDIRNTETSGGMRNRPRKPFRKQSKKRREQMSNRNARNTAKGIKTIPENIPESKEEAPDGEGRQVASTIPVIVKLPDNGDKEIPQGHMRRRLWPPRQPSELENNQVTLSEFGGKSDLLSRIPQSLGWAIFRHARLQKVSLSPARSQVLKNIRPQKEGRNQETRRHRMENQAIQPRKEAEEVAGRREDGVQEAAVRRCPHSGRRGSKERSHEHAGRGWGWLQRSGLTGDKIVGAQVYGKTR